MQRAVEPVPRAGWRVGPWAARAILAILAILASCPVGPSAFAAPPETNLALNRPYTLEPNPNYPLTTDPGDVVQLTDGKHAARGWKDRQAVGWSGARPVSITVDLGDVGAVSGVSFSTVAGRADVEWPSAILIFGSLDGRFFTYLGDLVALDGERRGAPPAGGTFARHVFETRKLKARARYVRLMVDRAGPYVFVDEIEIFGASLKRPPTAAQVLDTGAFFWRARAALRLRGATGAAIREAQGRVASSRLARTVRTTILSRVAGIRRRAARLTDDDWLLARPEYPANALHAAALAVTGQVERLEGAPTMRVWAANPWDSLAMTTVPDRNAAARVEMDLMNGEVRASAVNLRSVSDRTLRASVVLRIAGATNPAWVEVRSVAWTGGAEGEPVAAALVPLNRKDDRFSLDLLSGVTHQIWLKFKPAGLPEGVCTGELQVDAPGAGRTLLPVRVRIRRPGFPTAGHLRLSGWDYLNDPGGIPGSADYLERIASALRAHGADAPWATSAAMPFGIHDASGRMVRPPDTAVLDRWIARWRGAARYRVFLAAGDGIAGLKNGTTAFGAAVAAWARFWAKHLADRGIDGERVDLLFVDEPSGSRDVDRQVAWAGALKASGVPFRIWLNPSYADPSDIPARLIKFTDTLCINRQFLDDGGGRHRELAQELQKSGKRIEIYGAKGPTSSVDPYAYHRLHAWTAFDLNVSGLSFWSFTDTSGGNSWREYAGHGVMYAPLFLDGSTVVPGKHLEAIQEGLEDVEYLVMLRAAVAAATPHRSGDPVVAQARSLLGSAARRVLAVSHGKDLAWTSPKDRTVADRVRLEIADLLERLRSAPPAPRSSRSQ